MEFFRIINIKTTESAIQDRLTLGDLELLSNEIFIIGNRRESEVKIGGIWGEFTLNRKEIMGGLRFALLECPNALTWTVTTGFDPAPESIVVHLTINRKKKDPSFIEEIEEFLEDHCNCLGRLFSQD